MERNTHYSLQIIGNNLLTYYYYVYNKCMFITSSWRFFIQLNEWTRDETIQVFVSVQNKYILLIPSTCKQSIDINNNSFSESNID